MFQRAKWAGGLNVGIVGFLLGELSPMVHTPCSWLRFDELQQRLYQIAILAFQRVLGRLLGATHLRDLPVSIFRTAQIPDCSLHGQSGLMLTMKSTSSAFGKGPPAFETSSACMAFWAF